VIGSSRGFGATETVTCPGASPACPMVTPGDYVFEVLPALDTYLNDYTFSVTTQ
jgi:hypothetical protein